MKNPVSFQTAPSNRVSLCALALALSVGLSACGNGGTIEADESPAIEVGTSTVSDPVVETAETETSDIEAEMGAVTTDDDAIRQAGSHVHGAAMLAAVVEGDTLTIELETPLYNLLGFEHAPNTDAQRARLETAESVLADPTALFSTNADAACTSQSIDAVSLFGATDDGASEADGHDHDHAHDDSHDHDHGHEEDEAHDHDHDHDAAESHDHAHGESHEHDHDSVHREALLTYGFVCEDTASIAWIDHGLFDQFDNLETIEFVFLGPASQNSATIRRGTTRLSLED